MHFANGNNIYLRRLMNVLIRQATVVDPTSPFHLQPADIFLQNGFIASVSPYFTGAFDREITYPGLFVSPGWVDPFVHFWDPGHEQKETLQTGAAAAAAGGFTDVLLLPNTLPAIHNRAAVEYAVQRGRPLPVRLHPIGAVTQNTDGAALAEMYDMHSSGAVAFSDGLRCLQSPGLVLKALQYLKAIDSTVIQLPDDETLRPGGLMHEGITSTRLGLAGKPALSEELIVARDIELVRYTESKIHFTGVSTTKSIACIRAAKKEGLAVSCSVTPYHLTFCDEDVADYNPNFKVNPPLRTGADRQALRDAVTEGVIDCIASHHLPQERDSKMVEFEYAAFGAIGLQTSFAAVTTALPGLSPVRVAELFCGNARRLFRLEEIGIKEKEKACLTLFSMSEEWTFAEKNILSLSKNTPFTGKTFRGKPVGIFNKESLILNEY